MLGPSFRQFIFIALVQAVALFSDHILVAVSHGIFDALTYL